MEKCNDNLNIVAYYFIDEKDLKYENGYVRIKRKYGKYKREVIKIKKKKSKDFLNCMNNLKKK